MTPLANFHAHWPAVSELLDEALDRPASERAAWVAGLAGAPAEHREALMALLANAARVETDDFLGQLPQLPSDAMPQSGHIAATEAALQLLPGGQVGPYRLIKEIGRGGMGTVWLAERADGLVQRRVALKLPHAVWGGALADRFARERDILSTLAHDHIARLYDVGIDSIGRPYLAMEFVEGEAIDAYCRSRDLPLRGRIALLLQVMAAVAHAHARLVVHRDLKPSNILVTKEGQVQLLDFGIAKLLEGERTHDTALTELGGRALTLDYASPEQIRGEPLGTASDVYSLAVVAYEVLTGSRPYRLKCGSAAEREEAIAMADPPRASESAGMAGADPALQRQLRGDMDAILNKALKKDAADRYPTMRAFADDIERHLAGRPVLAQPDTRLYLTRKFIGRHRVGVSAAGAVLIALGMGLSVALWQTRVAQRNEQTAEQAVDREGAVKMLMMDTLSVVASAGPTGLSVPNAVGKTMLAKLEEYEIRFKDRPEQRLGLLEAVASQLPFFGDYEGSLVVGRRYLALLKAMHSDDWRVLRAYLGIATVLVNLNRLPEAELALREALATVPDTPGALNNRVAVMAELGKTLTRLGQRDEAGVVLTAAVARIPEFKDGSIRWNTRSALARYYMGFDEPRALQLMADAHAEYLGYAQAQSSELGTSYVYLGWALMSVGRLSEAERALVEGQRRFVEVYGKVDRDTVAALARLAVVIAGQGRYDEARQLLAQRRDETEAEPGSDTAGALATLRARQLQVELMAGDLKSAARFATLEALTTNPALSARDASVYEAGVAQYLALTGRPDEALRRLARALAARPAQVRWNADTFNLGVMRAQVQLSFGHSKQALEGLGELTAAMRALRATRNWPYREAQALTALASARLAASADSLALLKASDADSVGLQPPTPVDQADLAAIRVEVLKAAGRPGEAALALTELRANLNGQHADSPRLLAANRLAAMLN